MVNESLFVSDVYFMSLHVHKQLYLLYNYVPYFLDLLTLLNRSPSISPVLQSVKTRLL